MSYDNVACMRGTKPTQEDEAQLSRDLMSGGLAQVHSAE